MPQQESINCEGQQIPIIRTGGHEVYLTFTPPDGSMQLTAPSGTGGEELVAFVSQRLDIIHEMQDEMRKRYAKSPSLTCKFRTGDVAYILGRPFTIRVSPLKKGKSGRTATRGRVTLRATLLDDVSIMELFVVKENDYDQCRQAFMSYATKVFASNASGLLTGVARGAQLPESLPGTVMHRDMREAKVVIDGTHATTWVSDRLLPYPGLCLVYAFLKEAANQPESPVIDGDAESYRAFMDAACPDWRIAQQILSDPDTPYARQR